MSAFHPDFQPGARSTRLAPTALAFAVAITLAAPLAASAADAMRVVRDAATGELRAPTAAEAQAFEKAEAQLRAARAAAQPAGRVAAPVETRYPDGTVERRLDDDTLMYSVATTAADGSLAIDCLPAKEAQKRVKSSKIVSNAARTAAKAGHVHP